MDKIYRKFLGGFLEIINLKAQSEGDCDIISSLMQDSIFKVDGCRYFSDKKCFRILLNRFCWEHSHKFEQEQCYHRVHSGLYIHNIKTIHVNDNFQKKPHSFYNLLAMHVNKDEITLIFSDHRHIYIKVDGILIYLKDLHEHYPTLTKPHHNFLEIDKGC